MPRSGLSSGRGSFCTASALVLPGGVDGKGGPEPVQPSCHPAIRPGPQSVGPVQEFQFVFVGARRAEQSDTRDGQMEALEQAPSLRGPAERLPPMTGRLG